MKKLKSLGYALTKAEQKTINGSLRHFLGNECNTSFDCPEGPWDNILCCSGTCVYLNQNAQGIHC